MKKDYVTTFSVAAAYIGTIVGAGFATGQEMLQFFSRFGYPGLSGLIISTALFILFGDIIMRLGRRLGARSHMDIIRYSGGRIIGPAADALITIFLFGGLTSMIAGTGALFEQQFNLPALIGCLFMAAITAATVLTGISGVIKAISFVVPFLLLTVIGTSVYSMITTRPDITAAIPGIGENALISNWLLSAVLYVSYNTVISIAVLAPLGVRSKSVGAIRTGAILGGIGLGVGAVMIFFALSGHMNIAAGLEVPMVYIAGRLSSAIQTAYIIVLIAEIYTTAVGSLYGFAARLQELFKGRASWPAVVIIPAFIALAASRFGFSDLVRYLYPVVGYGGILLLLSLLFAEIRAKRRGKPRKY